MSATNDADERVLILAPSGRDSILAEQSLCTSGIESKVCRDISELIAEMRHGAGAALIASEALDRHSIDLLADTLSAQPAWSELGLIILTTGGATTPERSRQVKELSVLRNATLLERPLRASTLVNSITIALQGRRRQYELRDHLIERSRLESELEAAYLRQQRIAEALQRSVLIKPQRNAFPGIEIETVYQAAKDEAEIGGDFYDIFALDASKTAIVVGDVSGKGLEAASHTMEIKYALRAYLRERFEPGEALARLNRYLLDTQRLDPQSSEGFVCLCICVFDSTARAFRMSNAGIEPPLLLTSGGAAEQIEGNGPPLGVAEWTTYPEQMRSLTGDDILLIVTDGITEARRDADFFGHEGIVDAAQTVAGDDLEAITHSILESATSYGGGTLNDDVCIVAARLSS